MKSTPLVSVLITSYNRENLIREALESVLCQTYTNLDIIVSDNCSTDGTVAIVKEYLHDSRLRLFINENNIGQFPNRNKAASYARGKYLKYVDSDDYIYPWALECMVENMERFPGAGWGLCSMEPDIEKPFPFELTPKEAYEYHYLGPGLFLRAPLSSIIKKDVFDEAGGFYPIKMAGDYEMWHRLAQHYSVVLMAQGMVWHRTHASQEMNEYADFNNEYESVKVKYLDAKDCPLDKVSVASIRDKEKMRTVRMSWSTPLN